MFGIGNWEVYALFFGDIFKWVTLTSVTFWLKICMVTLKSVTLKSVTIKSVTVPLAMCKLKVTDFKLGDPP